MTADGQQKHTFPPVPEGGKIISEKDGVRKVKFEDGIVFSELSKEREEQIKKQPGYTPEQLRNAKPLEIIVPSRPNSAPQVDLQAPQPGGPPVKVPGRLPKKNLKTSSQFRTGTFHSLKAAEVPGAFKLLLTAALPLSNLRLAVGVPGAEPHSQPYQFPFTRNEVFDNYTVYPFRTIGRLFATEPSGMVAACSAAAVNSPNGRLIVTAAHCIRDGYGNDYSNIRFYPGFRDGATPYGPWTGCRIATAAAYENNTQDGNFAHDIGAVVACDQITPDGFVLSLQDEVGALGYQYNESRNQHWNAFGYPKGAPYNGNRLHNCQSSHGEDDPYYSSTYPTMGIGCDLSAGTSGGPWITDFNRNTVNTLSNYINGVHSYKKLGQQRALYSPYFGNNFINLYNRAVNQNGA